MPAVKGNIVALKARNRRAKQELAQDGRKAGQYVRRLQEIAEMVETVEPSQVPALRLKADIYSRLLAKCLPDLKAVEQSVDIRQRHKLQQSFRCFGRWF
ncbi:MAG: hypothetical protein H0W33_11370 [Gammaproteobacteria bacterium]|nr:hypothetical protein [Gammaproteobacteria bacterium]